MKIIIFLFIFIASLFADHHNESLKIQILEHICDGIKNIEKMKIYSDDTEIQEAFKHSHKFKIAKSLALAQIVILSKDTNNIKTTKQQHIFVLHYCLLEKIPNSFGAFFWKKGRPNIVFIKPRLQKQSLHLSNELNQYVEEKIW